jgi:hypothetical protein
MPTTNTVIAEIAAERERQVTSEGFTPAHDDQWIVNELASAAACYARPDLFPLYWSWDWQWWKPKDRRRNLIRSAALLVAEIERLDRAALADPAGANGGE